MTSIIHVWQRRTWPLPCTCLTSRWRHPAPGQDLILLQRLRVFAHSWDPHPAMKLWCQVPFTKSKTIFQTEVCCMQCFLKSKYIKVELSMIKIGELLRKLWSFRSCILILPPGALTPQGIGCAMKRGVSKHWRTLQWCASRGWVIAHENWTSCQPVSGNKSYSTESTTNKGLNLHSPLIELVVKLVGFSLQNILCDPCKIVVCTYPGMADC